MKTLLRFAFAFLFTCHFPAFAEETAPAPPSKPMLWRIEGPKPSYVLGTIHLPNPAVARIDAQVNEAIAASDIVLTEVAFDAATITDAAKDMFLPPDKKLADLLPEDLHREIVAEFERIMPTNGPRLIERVKIMYVNVLLGMLEEQLKNPGVAPLDMLIATRAGALAKKTGGLETVAEQMAVMNAFTNEEQITMLRDAVRILKDMRKAGTDPIKEMTAAYRSGDLAALDKVMNDYLRKGDKATGEKFIRILLTERNHLMAERATARMKAEPDKAFLFAVGAGHLYGDEGLLKLLEKAGCKLVRVGGAAAK